jgi:uncharacterized protein (UPF0335 family)
MTMTVGENSQQRLRSFVERLEAIHEQKKQFGDDEKAIMAEAKAEGFMPAAIRYVLKVRRMKPHDRQESEAIRDMYLNAMGMASEPPLFRFAGLAAVDNTARDQVIDGMKNFVPPHGQGRIDVKFGADTIRLERQKDGSVSAANVIDSPRSSSAGPVIASPQPRAPVPDVDAAGAVELGRQAARDNCPVIDNPFPFGDPRRAKFDEGWRIENGGDGMGPGGDD